MRGDPRHPAIERLAAYADGALAADARAELEAHLVDCDDCRAIVAEAVDFNASAAATPPVAIVSSVRPARSRQRVVAALVGLAAAAAVMLAVRVVRPEWMSGLFGPRTDRPELQELIAAVAKEPTRPVEGRLTGGFKYAPPPLSAVRGPGDRQASPDVKIAAARIEKLASGNEAPRLRAALGVAYLSLGDLDRAIEALQEATQGESANASYQSDLSAAYIERAQSQGTAQDWPRALAAAERALSADQGFVLSRFNRALALEGMLLRDQAAQAWRDYLTRDPSSQWASEARRRLEALSKLSPAARWNLLRERFERGEPIATELVAEEMTLTRDYWERKLAPAWARDAMRPQGRNDTAFVRLKAVADAVLTANGDRLPFDTVQFLATRYPHNHLIARDILRLEEGRRAYDEYRFDEAREAFTEATRGLSDAGAPLAVAGRLHAGITLFLKRDLVGARSQLEQVVARSSSLGYHAIAGRAQWTLGILEAGTGNAQSALLHYALSQQHFHNGHEPALVSFVAALVAEVYHLSGLPAASWPSIMAALSSLDSTTDFRRRLTVFFVGSDVAIKSDLPEVAVHFQDAFLQAASDAGVPTSQVEGLLARARTLAQLDRVAEARTDLTAAQQLIDRHPDLTHQAFLAGELLTLQAEHPQSATAPRNVIEASDAALTYMRRTGRRERIPQLHYVKGMALERAGQAHDAEAEYEESLEAFTAVQHRSDPSILRSARLDLVWDAVLSAVRLKLSTGDDVGALELIERAKQAAYDEPRHVTDAATAKAFAGSLASNVAVVYYVPTLTGIETWTLRRGRIAHRALHVLPQRVDSDIRRFRRAIANDDASWRELATSLHQQLIGPVAADLAGADVLVICPAGSFGRLPWKALRDDKTRHYLVQDYVVVVNADAEATLAAVPLTADDRPPSRFLGMAIARSASWRGHLLPSLPYARAEVTTAAARYPAAEVRFDDQATKAAFSALAAHADVIHLAAHAVVDEDNPFSSALVLAPAIDDDGYLRVSDLAAGTLQHSRLVVLAACRSADGQPFRGDGVINLTRAFLRAGAHVVAGALWDVGDRETRAFFTDVHAELARGVSAASAFTNVERRLAADSHGLPRVWAAFLVSGAERHWFDWRPQYRRPT